MHILLPLEVPSCSASPPHACLQGDYRACHPTQQTLCFLYLMYGSTSLRLMLSLLSESQQVPFLLPDALWMLNCQYPRWFIYFGICFSFHVELLRSVSAEIISRPLEDFLLSPLLTSALFSCSWGCAPSIKQTAQTSCYDFQNRTETAIDSVQLTTVLVITPPFLILSVDNFASYFTENEKSGKAFLVFPAPKPPACICAWVLCSNSVTINFHHSCPQTTPPLVHWIPAFLISSFLPCLLDHYYQERKHKTKNLSFNSKSLSSHYLVSPLPFLNKFF